MQHNASKKVARNFNVIEYGLPYSCTMSNKLKNNEEPSGHRHFVAEWAKHRGKRQVDIVRDLGIDKGLVSKWFKGSVLPGPDHMANLAEYFGAEEPASLLRDPNDDWLSRFFRDKTEEQKEAAIDMLKLFFKERFPGASEEAHKSRK